MNEKHHKALDDYFEKTLRELKSKSFVEWQENYLDQQSKELIDNVEYIRWVRVFKGKDSIAILLSLWKFGWLGYSASYQVGFVINPANVIRDLAENEYWDLDSGTWQ